MDYFIELEKHIYETPVAKNGYSIVQQEENFTTVYDGRFLPSFILDRGGDYIQYRKFLMQNRIGSIFDLEEGTEVFVGQGNEYNVFSAHPES